jgi:hypothetical protein
MNPNITMPAESTSVPMPANIELFVLSAIVSVGLLAFVLLWIRCDLRISKIRRNFFHKRRDVERQYSSELYELSRENPANQVIQFQIRDASPVNVPVTNCDVRNRRNITRLY